ncbi:MAG: cobyric acid synthase [Lachnospiraceae bacterium]|nr:cobyric acid synthase [Lachnospiraceae bacterium]
MAKAIMIQGTMSNAGKSLIAAGLCRIFRQDGYRVAPFKSQNMALNSFITKEGMEMGRAQVMQAEAAGTEPSVLMNPILLKPTNDTGSQVIVNGEVRGNMSAAEYFRYKKELIPDIMCAYRTLDEAYDIIVIEGAGSPAEINLKTEDIVNMGMAKMAKAPVLLAGDIDRGGVFAQLYGTILLLDEDERSLVKGLIINKFRGDQTILDPGIRMLEELCKKEVVGVVPYMDVDLEDEDSLSERLERGNLTEGENETRQPDADRTDSGVGRYGGGSDEDSLSERPDGQRSPGRYAEDPDEDSIQEQADDSSFAEEPDRTWMTQMINLAVIRFPRISNFTDFHVFECIEGVSVRYVKQPAQLGSPDLIFLPGTKNTMRDMLWMRQSGMEGVVLKAKERGTVIFGICGGFQMLGQSISDPDGVEEGGKIRGMGLLAMETVFAGEKTRTRVDGTFGRISGVLKDLSGVAVSGYEIHMGQSRFSDGSERDAVSLFSADDPGDTDPGENRMAFLANITDCVSGMQKPDGAYCGNVYGTYIHGIFDREEAALCVVQALAARRGIDLSAIQAVDYAAYKEQQYDQLAETLRLHLNMDRIYEILEAGAGADEKRAGTERGGK